MKIQQEGHWRRSKKRLGEGDYKSLPVKLKNKGERLFYTTILKAEKCVIDKKYQIWLNIIEDIRAPANSLRSWKDNVEVEMLGSNYKGVLKVLNWILTTFDRENSSLYRIEIWYKKITNINVLNNESKLKIQN